MTPDARRVIARPNTMRQTGKPTRVVLRLWGCTAADVERANDDARHWQFSSTWEIVEVIPSSGTPCPIPRDDPIALKQNAVYDAAWAAYRAEGTR